MRPERHVTSARLPRHRREDGAAFVEFVFVMILLFTLLFGIITFGLLLSFKQNLTQAAAEGARAGATAFAGDSINAAMAATDSAVATFDQPCSEELAMEFANVTSSATGDGRLACAWHIGDCGEAVPDTTGDDPAVDNCITVGLVYNYDGYPLLPTLPLLEAAYPDILTSASTSEINPTP